MEGNIPLLWREIYLFKEGNIPLYGGKYTPLRGKYTPLRGEIHPFKAGNIPL